MRHLIVLNMFRLNGVDVGVTFEIFGVKGQQILDVVNFHCGDDFGIVDLNALDGIIDDEFAPVFVNVERIGQKVENLFDFGKFRFGLDNRKT